MMQSPLSQARHICRHYDEEPARVLEPADFKSPGARFSCHGYSAGGQGELRDIAAKQSATLTGAASASGWKIAPADSQLTRVATNLNYKELHRQLPNTRFVDLQSNNILMLVYFDR